MAGSGGVLFEEVQSMRVVWMKISIAVIAGILWFGIIRQVVFKKPFGSNPAPDSVLVILWVLIGIFMPVLLYKLRLRTAVYSDSIELRFTPLRIYGRKLPIDEIVSFQNRVYKPIREYGGWGIRIGFRKRAVSMSGNRGVELVLKNGKKFMIGTQRPDELYDAIQTAVSKQKGSTGTGHAAY